MTTHHAFFCGILMSGFTVAAGAQEAGPAKGPLRVHPGNPRYFTDGTGRAVYLTGSHVWENFQDRGTSSPPPAFDFTAYLDFLRARNHNFIRLWAWENARWAPWTTGDIYFAPMPFARTGPGNALDGGPKYDLTKFNQAYFDRLRTRVLAARDRGVYVSLMLFQGWSIDNNGKGTGNPWPGHPFHGANNINGVNGDVNGDGEGEEVHRLAIPAVTAFQEAYVRKVIDTVNDLDNVLYEISNESTGPATTAWQYHMIDYIHAYEAGKPKRHPVGMTFQYPGGSNDDLFNSPAEWISPNSTGGYRDNPPAAGGQKVILSDTDHLWGEGGDGTWVWKSFTRGLNVLFMDGGITTFPPTSDWRESARNAMGHTLRYAARMDLAAMTPRGDLASTGYALANPGCEYLVFQPGSGGFTVNLAAGVYAAEWFNPSDGSTGAAPQVAGGGPTAFTPPFGGTAVLYLRTARPALNYAYYEGEWSSLPDFAALRPVKAGTAGGIDLSARGRDDFFGFVFTGTLSVPSGGTWTFFTTSDDGSRLYVDGVPVVDNDGLHGMQERSGSVPLSAGPHAFRLEYFERSGEQGLEVQWQGPGTPRQEIPASAFSPAGDPAAGLGGEVRDESSRCGALGAELFFALILARVARWNFRRGTAARDG